MKKVLVVLTSLVPLTGCTGTMPKQGVVNSRQMQCSATQNCVHSQEKDKNNFIEPIFISSSSLEKKYIKNTRGLKKIEN
jgi:uncharacterized protein (DUF1499 family)